MDSILKTSLLYDFYGQLLSKRQKDVVRLYHEENLSLSEIAAEYGISRQGVHDSLKAAEGSLLEYEKKLGMVHKMENQDKAVMNLRKALIFLDEKKGPSAAKEIKEALGRLT